MKITKKKVLTLINKGIITSQQKIREIEKEQREHNRKYSCVALPKSGREGIYGCSWFGHHSTIDRLNEIKEKIKCMT